VHRGGGLERGRFAASERASATGQSKGVTRTLLLFLSNGRPAPRAVARARAPHARAIVST
jgi:hypothetical protein